MKAVQHKIFTLIIALFTGFFAAVSPAFSQQNAQSVFNSTVDQINCETIRFIHREAGRAEIANNLECFSFESIYKSIPEDEGRTTAQVAKDIEAFKTKYKPDTELGAQLDNVISYANKKIQAKPRRGNVSDFKQKLQDYKKDALDNISGANAATNTATTGTGGIDDEGEETGIVITDEEEIENAPGNTGWLTYLSLLIALGSLLLSAYLFTRLGKLSKLVHSTPKTNSYAEPETNRARGPQVNESAANYQLLETKMHQEIARLSREFDEKLAAVTASTGYTQPETYAYNTEKPVIADKRDDFYKQDNITEENDEDDEIEFLPTPLDQADAPILTTEQRVQEDNEKESESETPSQNAQQETFVKDENEDEDLHNTTDDEISNEKEQETDAAIQNTFRSDDSSNITSAVPPQITQTTVLEDEEEGVALPDYKYIGLPLHDGSFSPESFTEAPTQDSLYEVEMYEDVPNKAFFSPLLYPEIIDKALQDPARYLSPCCAFLNDPTGKQAITIVDEGRLRRQGERWYIYEKAKIRFD